MLLIHQFFLFIDFTVAAILINFLNEKSFKI